MTEKQSPLPDESNKLLKHVWILEDATGDAKNVLTPAGVENIANHKYVPGEYTILDNILNPIWTYLTNLLPLWLAPNMVTTLGGLHCGLSYAVLWYYNPKMTTSASVPDFVFLLAGYCTIAYYTLDCMDGKQARRTGTSSPLGQLFDHGFDCICNLSHVAVSGSYLMLGGTYGFLVVQLTLQFAFFTAQWEEYYTRVLPHAVAGCLGVTETNYTIGVISLINAFIDREAYWTGKAFPSEKYPFLPQSLTSLNLQRRDMVPIIWSFLICLLVMFSIQRTMAAITTTSGKLSALSKFITPMVICTLTFLLPETVIQNHSRYVSLSAGLLFSLVTKKVIVFSMAKMAYASLQLDVFVYVIVTGIIFYDVTVKQSDARVGTFLMGLTLFHAHRLVSWCRLAILQITKRLDIYCFTIKKKEG